MNKKKNLIFVKEGYQITITPKELNVVSIDYHASNLNITWEMIQEWQALAKELDDE